MARAKWTMLVLMLGKKKLAGLTPDVIKSIRWIAQDVGGSWYGFTHKPTFVSGKWLLLHDDDPAYQLYYLAQGNDIDASEAIKTISRIK